HLVLVNPEMLDLHPMLHAMRRKLETTSVSGLQFLSSADNTTRPEHRAKSILSLVANYKHVRTAFQKMATAEGVEFVNQKHVQLHRIDETGLDVTLGKAHLTPKALVLAGPSPSPHQSPPAPPKPWARAAAPATPS